MSKKFRSNILLLITAMVWGGGFVAQKAGAMLGPFTYTGIRTLVAAVAILPVILVFDKLNAKEKEAEKLAKTAEQLQAEKKVLIKGGVATGLVLCVASNLQQAGIYFDTDAGKAGFITALYIVIVPILGMLFGKKVRPIIWFCVFLGAVGFYLLTMAGHGTKFSLQTGDFFVLLCAFAYSGHIITIDHFSPKCDGMKMSLIQFVVCGGVTSILMFIFEDPQLSVILDCAGPILYAGVISAGLGFTFQILGQKDADPTVASLIMSLESVFAVIFGVLIIHESLTLYEGLGCLVIFAAVIISQLPSKEERLAAKGN